MPRVDDDGGFADFPSRRLDYARMSIMPTRSTYSSILGLAKRYAPEIGAIAGAGAAEYAASRLHRGGALRQPMRGGINPDRVISHSRRIPSAVNQQILKAYVQLRAAGLGHKAAKRAAWGAAGLFLARRRLRPTNVKALRRAMRRVRGARRVLGKIRGLMRPRYHPPMFRKRYHRRGDVDAFNPWDAEDMMDYQDELEDLGYDEPGYSFPGGE